MNPSGPAARAALVPKAMTNANIAIGKRNILLKSHTTVLDVVKYAARCDCKAMMKVTGAGLFHNKRELNVLTYEDHLAKSFRKSVATPILYQN